ncbi:MAG TPA: peptidylprolyl isomerase [Anaerolineales bacterium]|nr:peptidylprolyl isomerase [Anaerolineales bacterium]
MSDTPKEKIPQTKKHLARQQREDMQRRYLLIGVAVILVAVIGVILYGFLYEGPIQDSRAIVTVNGDKVTTKQFEGLVRYTRYSLIQNAANTYQLAQMFGTDPSIQSSILSQMSQTQSQMESSVVGQQMLDRVTNDLLIRQEAERRGITVTEAEIDKSFQEAFGYFPDGTSTPTATLEQIPTSTYSPLQMTVMAPTATLDPTVATATAEALSAAATATAQAAPATAMPEVAITPTPEVTPTQIPTATSTPSGPATATPTLAPTATATPYTLEGYQNLYRESITGFKDNYAISEADLRYVIESQLYYFKVFEAVVAELDVPRTQEQVWARHILLETKEQAEEVMSLLEGGMDFAVLAKTYSTDTSSKDQGGDLGWFGTGFMVAPFEEAVFALEPGQVSEIVETDFGFHIIQSLGKEERPLSAEDYQAEQTAKFEEWLAAQKEAATIVTLEDWLSRVPDDPIMPPEISNYINELQTQFLQSQATQSAPLTAPTTAPTTQP